MKKITYSDIFMEMVRNIEDQHIEYPEAQFRATMKAIKIGFSDRVSEKLQNDYDSYQSIPYPIDIESYVENYL